MFDEIKSFGTADGSGFPGRGRREGGNSNHLSNGIGNGNGCGWGTGMDREIDYMNIKPNFIYAFAQGHGDGGGYVNGMGDG